MTDDIVTELRIAVVDYQRHSALADLLEQSVAEIERLRAALRLAAIEVFGQCDPLSTSPDDLVRHFYEEARRG